MSEADLQAHRDELVQKLDIITEQLLSFNATVLTLKDDFATEQRRSSRERLVLRLAVGGLVLDLVLSVLLSIGYFRQAEASLQQAETTRQQQEIVAQQESTRSDVLCPLFAIFLGAYDPTSRAEGYARDSYEDAYRIMRDVYGKVLHCTQPPVPPRTKPISLGPDMLFPTPAVPVVFSSAGQPISRIVGSTKLTLKPGKVRVSGSAGSSGSSTVVSSAGSAARPVASTAKAVTKPLTSTVKKTTKAVTGTVKKTAKVVSGTTKKVSKSVGSAVKNTVKKLGLK